MKRYLGKTVLLGFAAVSSMLMFGVNGKAYIDPSVSTYIIQAVAGLVIAIGAVVGVYFRKMKKKVNKKLGIDENKNKEVEADDILKENSEKDA